MSYQKPTLSAVVESARADIESKNPKIDAHATNGLANVLAYVVGAAAHSLYGFVDWVSRQILPDTCDKEMLERHAGLRDMTYLEPAYASGKAIVAGNEGAVLPAETIVQSSAGIEYRITADAVVGEDAQLEAVDPGAAGNLAAGSKLSLQSPVEGIQGTMIVGVDGITGGAEQETVERLRQRVLQDMREPAVGGGVPDYKKWAMEAHPSVTRVWVTDEDGPPYVNVRVVCDDLGDGPEPPEAVLEAVQAKLDAERVVGARPTAMSPVFDDIIIDLRVTPDTLAVRAAAEAEVRDLWRREAEPGGTIPRTHIDEAISIAPGEFDHHLLSPAADVAMTAGHMSRIAGFTWE